MIVHWGVYAALVVQLLNLAPVFAVPSPYSSSHDRYSLDSSSHSRAVIEAIPEHSASASNIERRDWRNHLNLFAVTVGIGGRWVLKYHALDLIRAPGGPALSVLIQFYNDVLFIGRDDWANEPTQLFGKRPSEA